jgi:lysophospholipase L1-like esterase
MNHENIEFHNTVEMEPAAAGGLAMRRFPRAVRSCLGQLGRMMSQDSSGCEIRFVTDAQNVRVSISSQPDYSAAPQHVSIFKGAFFHSLVPLTPGTVTHIHLSDVFGDMTRLFKSLKPEVRDTDYFAHNVWRILFGCYEASFHQLDTYGYTVRPPNASEKPKKRMLCYGSSITHGAITSAHHLSYIQQAARHLKADVFNQGLGGSCLCEPEMAGYLAGRSDWDWIVLELGVNMRDSFTPEVFEARSRYLIRTIIAAHPGKPVFLITIYPNAESACNAAAGSEIQSRQLAFDESLRATVRALNCSHLHLIEGHDVLTDYRGITRDLIHPGDYGHTEMGLNLAQKIQAIVGAGTV